MCACRRSRALDVSRSPRASPSCTRAILSAPLRASRTDISPFAPDAVPLTSTSSPPTWDVFSSPSDCGVLLALDLILGFLCFLPQEHLGCVRVHAVEGGIDAYHFV